MSCAAVFEKVNSKIQPREGESDRSGCPFARLRDVEDRKAARRCLNEGRREVTDALLSYEGYEDQSRHSVDEGEGRRLILGDMTTKLADDGDFDQQPAAEPWDMAMATPWNDRLDKNFGLESDLWKDDMRIDSTPPIKSFPLAPETPPSPDDEESGRPEQNDVDDHTMPIPVDLEWSWSPFKEDDLSKLYISQPTSVLHDMQNLSLSEQPPTFHRFFDLAPEIREMILALVVGTDATIRLLDRHPLNVFLSHRQIYQEASHIYYTRNMFQMGRRERRDLIDHPDTDRPLLRKPRRLQVQLRFYRTLHVDEACEQVRYEQYERVVGALSRAVDAGGVREIALLITSSKVSPKTGPLFLAKSLLELVVGLLANPKLDMGVMWVSRKHRDTLTKTHSDAKRCPSWKIEDVEAMVARSKDGSLEDLDPVPLASLYNGRAKAKWRYWFVGIDWRRWALNNLPGTQP